MGMDVCGQAPRSAAGKYFRRNIRHWPPLAGWITTVWPGLTSACQYWFSNDGDGLNDEQSVALADAIDEHLASGQFDRLMTRLMADLPEGSHPPLEAEDLREFSAFLRDCGGFKIY